MRLNTFQVKTLSIFFLNMSVAWFVAAFISPVKLVSVVVFTGYGIISLYISLILLKEVKE